VKTDIAITQKTPQGEIPMQMETVIVYPDHLHAKMSSPNGTVNIVGTPQAAFVALPNGQVQAFPERRKADLLEQIKRDPLFIASHWKDADVFFRAGGTEKIGEVETRIVDVNSEGVAIRWFVDPQSDHIVKETYATLSQTGPALGETYLDNWKPIAGLTLPLLRRNKQNGEDSSTAEYKNLEINPSVDPKLFEKPAENSPAQH